MTNQGCGSLTKSALLWYSAYRPNTRKMKTLVFLTLFAAATATFQYTAEWELWKREHGRDYHTEEEETHRHTIWEEHKKYVDVHNKRADIFGFTLAMNQYADLHNDEFRQIFNGLLPRDLSRPRNGTNVRRVNFNVNDLPATVDWRPKGVVTPIKNQGTCGSCWAFSATGSLEGQHALKTGKLVSLSEQQLIDCSKSFHNNGCEGGLPDYAFEYLATVKGDDTEQSYPYRAEDGAKCLYNPSNVAANTTGHVDIRSKNEDALMEAVANVGPISTGMDASHITFQLYHSGVYNPWFLCSQTRLDHGVLVIGYGSEAWLFGSHKYWLVKNSWGTGWGEKGFFKIRRGDNKCGIATQASYPTGVN